jgi:predicted HTH transcriptional regulator
MEMDGQMEGIRTNDPDWAPWIVFFLRALQRQKRDLEKKIEREQIMLGDLPELSVNILELARARGRVTIAEAVKLTGASRNTVKDHVRALTDRKQLTRHGAGRGAWYAPS